VTAATIPTMSGSNAGSLSVSHSVSTCSAVAMAMIHSTTPAKKEIKAIDRGMSQTASRMHHRINPGPARLASIPKISVVFFMSFFLNNHI
jgi:hypothetical protein